LTPSTASDRGLVNRIDGDPLAAAREMSELIADFPQETVRTDRAAVYEGLGASMEQGLALEAWHGSRAQERRR